MADRFKMVDGIRILMTDAEKATRAAEETEASRPRTNVEKDATATKKATQFALNPALLVLARAAGLTDAQFKTDVTAEIRSGL